MILKAALKSERKKNTQRSFFHIKRLKEGRGERNLVSYTGPSFTRKNGKRGIASPFRQYILATRKRGMRRNITDSYAVKYGVDTRRRGGVARRGNETGRVGEGLGMECD